MFRIHNTIKRLVVAAMLLVGSAHVGAAMSTDADTQDVEHVLDAFHDAVYANDGNRLASLFIPEGSSWVSVLTDDSYAKLKAARPGITKIKVGSYQDFVKMVSAPDANLRPTRSNVVIHTDGSVASVYFDYVFVISGVEKNRGHETWQLVKGTDGWRIAAIAYSSMPRLN
jgi:ketosteroid isomerase-like protein